ncbi:MAG: hypothetical protein FWD90_06110 [Defluviitaleaceae bacterium]|nr:hypothetical protein [Defluviitaleaceae bacterium]
MQNSTLRRAATLHPSLIPEPFNAIMEQYGFDAVCTIADYFGGATVYIPCKRTIFRNCLEREAVKELDGTNYLTLMRKYGFSERHLRRLLNKID